MEPTTVCPKCNGKLVEGFIPDSNPGMVFVNTWVEGPPEKSFIRGTKIEGKRRFYASTYRCEKCGYLESYARDEVE